MAIVIGALHPTIGATRIATALRNSNYYFETKQPEKAKIELETISLIEPWRELPWAKLAAVFLEQGNPQKSIDILVLLSRKRNLSPRDWLTLAKGFAQIGQMDNTEAALLALLDLKSSDPVTVEAFQLLINQYRSQNRLIEAFERQTELSKFVPDKKEFILDRVLLQLAIQPEEGIQEWERITGKPTWLVQLGSQIIAASLEKDPTLRMVKLGSAFGSFALWDLSEYWLQQAVENSPDYAEAWAFLAEARQERGLDGKTEITHALQLAPSSHGVRALAAIYYRRQRQFNTALALIQKNIDDSPAESIWYQELGSILAETGKMEDALSAYQEAVELSPLDYTKLTALARFCVQYDYLVKEIGLPAAQKAIELAADEPESQDIYGQTLLVTGDNKQATEAFSVALSLNPDYAPTWLHIGQAALSQGDSILAKEALMKTVTISGNSSESETARRLLKQYFLVDMDLLKK